MLIPNQVHSNGDLVIWKFYVNRDVGPPCAITAVVNAFPGLTFQSITSSKPGVSYVAPNITWTNNFISGESAEVNITYQVTDITQLPTVLTVNLIYVCDSIITNNTLSETLGVVNIPPVGGAVNDCGGPCVDVSVNDTTCSRGVTTWVVVVGSEVNGVLSSFDTTTGTGVFTPVDPRQPASFQYTMWCDTGSGPVQVSGPATYTIPPVSSAWVVLVKEDFNPLPGGNTVTLSTVPLAGYDVFVYRNGVELPFTEYSVSGSVVTFVNPFGPSGGGLYGERIAVHYYKLV